MKKARMNISHCRFIIFKLKICGEIVTTVPLFLAVLVHRFPAWLYVTIRTLLI